MGKNGKATKFCVCIEPHNVIREKRPVAILTLCLCICTNMRQFFANFAKAKTYVTVQCKKMLTILPSPAGMALTKLSLASNNEIFPGQGEFG
jgi:hypothetical protein